MKLIWIVGSLGTFLIASTLHFSYYENSDIKTLPSETLLSNPEGPRSLELGTPVIKKDDSNSETQVLLNDPKMAKNWGLISGQKNIKASKAWSITQGRRDIVVAVIDTGVDISHPDIKNNLWKNPGECGNGKENNSVDDDHNGYIDDCHGFNFIKNNGSDISDNHGHGTHIAGIIGAEGGNKLGISGVAPKVSLMILKYYDPNINGIDNLKNTIRAIHYARKMNAHIINYSGGGLEFSQREYEAVQLAQKSGILFVAAAGNERSNSDSKPYFPANYNLDNIISVTAINQQGHVLGSSNYGERTVHLGAPGENIYSTLPEKQFGLMTGTSQATAFVSGVAALIKANNKQMNYKMIRRQILATVDPLPSLFKKSKTSGILNSWAALAIQPLIATNGAIVQSQSSTLEQKISKSNDPFSSLSGILNFLRSQNTLHLVSQ